MLVVYYFGYFPHSSPNFTPNFVSLQLAIFMKTNKDNIKNVLKDNNINPIINEVKYSLSLYQSQTSGSVEKVVLVGFKV